MSIIPVSVALAKIEAGLKAICQRVNRQLLVAVLSLAVGALFVLIAAVIWVALRGSLQAFEWVAYAAIVLVPLLAVLTGWRLWQRWESVRGAARLADQRASMKELLTTALWLKETRREPGFASVLLAEAVDREAQWEAPKIAPRHMPKGVWILLIGLAALASTAFLIRSGSSAALGPDSERMVRAVAPAEKQQGIANAQQSIRELARSMASAPEVQLAAAPRPGDAGQGFNQPGDHAQPSSREEGTDQQETSDGEIEDQAERAGEIPELPTVYDPLGLQPRARTREKEGPNAPEFQVPTEGEKKPPPGADGSGGVEGPEDQHGTKPSDGEGDAAPEDVSQPAPSGMDNKATASSAAGAAPGQGEGIGAQAAGQAGEGAPGSAGAAGAGERGRGSADAAVSGEGGGGEARKIPGGGGSKGGTESSPETLLSGTGELDATSARTFRLTLDSFLDKTKPTVRGSRIEVTKDPSGDNPNLVLNPEQVADDALRRGDIPPGYEDIVRRIYSALAEP